MKRTAINRLATVAVIAVATLAAAGAGAGEADIKYRQAVMKAVGGHMGAISTILKSEGNTKHLKPHAEAMAALSEIAGDIFPENSSEMEGPTGALGAIWDKPKEFAAVQKTFRVEAGKLAKLAGGGDMAAIGAQVAALGKNACKACHTDFRAKKK